MALSPCQKSGSGSRWEIRVWGVMGEDAGMLGGGSHKAEGRCEEQGEIRKVLTRLARAYTEFL